MQLRNYLHLKNIRLLYVTLVQSIIQYGIIGWGCAYKNTINPLILLQKRFIKICLNKPIDYPTKLLYKEFEVFDINQIYYNSLIKYFHKIFYNLQKFKHTYDTKNMNTLHLYEPKCKTNIAFKHSSNYGPRIYNKLTRNHPEIINANNREFKKISKNFILNEYIC